MNTVTCLACGWVHFQVGLDYVIKWEKDWEIYWATLDDEDRDLFGSKDGPPRIEKNYLNCMSCNGSHKNFRDSRESDCKGGSTVNPILSRDFDFDRNNICPISDKTLKMIESAMKNIKKGLVSKPIKLPEKKIDKKKKV